MAISFVDSATYSAGGETTGGTIVIPGCAVGDDLIVCVLSRGHDSSKDFPTCTDDDAGGNLWTRFGSTGSRKGHMYWKKATSGTGGKTITIAGCFVASAAGVAVYRGGASGNPITNWATESNAGGDETQAEFLPSESDSEIFLAVFNNTNNILVTDPTCSNPGALTPRFERLTTTAGGDCAVFLSSALQVGGPTLTGTFAWTQSNNAQHSVVWSLMPEPGSPDPPISPPVRPKIRVISDAVHRSRRW